MLSYLDFQSEETIERICRLFRHGQIGRCVNGVTHEINNYLGAIMAYAELLQLESSLSPEGRRMASEMVKAARACADLVSTFTGIARKDRPSASVASPQQVLEQVLGLRAYSLKVGRIAVERHFPETMLTLVIDLPRLTQALLYIVVNAEEALEQVEQKVLRVTVKNTSDAVEIAVWNSGPPVSEQDRERVFERFFTGKGEDHLGLGLPFARHVAQLHDGDLTYHPDTGFVLRLPQRNSLSRNP